MKERFVKTTRKSGTSLAINIPSEIVHILNIKEGDILNVEVEKRKKDGDK